MHPTGPEKPLLILSGFRVMPYSTGCCTPLSNFEASQNYKDVQDPAVTVSFPLEDEPGVDVIAWTTTPWTLPSNMALCVHPEMDYVKVKVSCLLSGSKGAEKALFACHAYL